MIETLTGSYTLKQILQEHWSAFKEKHGDRLRPSITEEVEKVLACRDPFQQGYHLYRCPNGCSFERIVPHSCKSRFCSSCGKVTTDTWMATALGSFLNVPYHHLVFTLPQELRNVFAYDRGLLGILFTSAKDTVIEWCRDEAGYIPGIVMIMHTFGSDLKWNPHIHMLITEGGLSCSKDRWIHNEFIPWSVLKSRWKYHVVRSVKPKLKKMIQTNHAGCGYQRMGTGRFFRSVLGYALSEDLVCVDGNEVGYCTVHDALHWTVCQTASDVRESY